MQRLSLKWKKEKHGEFIHGEFCITREHLNMSTNSCFTFRNKSLSLMSLFLHELFESLAEERAALPPRCSQSPGTSCSSRLHKSSLAV